jgi:CcmD family protein
MENLSYLFAAFATVWLLIFFYIYRMSQKQKSLQEEIERLKNILEQKKP